MNRKFKLTAVALTSALALGLVAAQAQAESITVVSWGGGYTKSRANNRNPGKCFICRYCGTWSGRDQ